MKGHGLLERVDKHYAYRLTEKGVRVSAMFVLFHKRICGPLANTLFHHKPRRSPRPPVNIETAYHKADTAIQKLIDHLSQAFNLAWPASPRFGQLVQASSVTEQNLEERRR
jgi:hypothetical protein